MRYFSLAVVALSVSLVLAGCNAGASARGGVEQVGAGLGDAVTAPLDDLNLRRQEIPTVLLQAESNPYDLRNLNHCRTIAAEIARLDEALGPDTDAPPSQDGSYLSERAADAAAAPINATVRKTSAGAADRIPVVSVTNLARTLRALQKLGVWIYGLDGAATQAIHGIDFTGNVAIVMGGEGEGMRRLTREHCDGLVRIPMPGEMESLNVSVATGVALFEVVRQRGAKA